MWMTKLEKNTAVSEADGANKRFSRVGCKATQRAREEIQEFLAATANEETPENS